MQIADWDYKETVQKIAGNIANLLADNAKVLWLTSGGSNVAIQVDIMSNLRQLASDKLSNLVILPGDERFGANGHAYSNYAALKTAGFSPGSAKWPNILEQDINFAQTAEAYSQQISSAIRSADYVVATLGLGSDGHTVGILPHTTAVSATSPVFAYQSNNLQRMTVTFPIIRQLTHTYVVLHDQSKIPLIKQLQTSNDNYDDMPAAIFNELPNCTIINTKGDDV